MKFLVFLIVVLSSFSVLSSEYSIDFDKIGDSIVVTEIVDGIQKERYVDNDALERSKDGFIFIEKVSFNQNLDYILISLKLDEGYVIGDSGVYPAGYTISTDGKTLVLKWNITNVKSGQSIALFADLKDLRNEPIIAYIIISLFIMGIILFLVRHSLRIGKRKNLDKYLLDIERKILEELRKADRHEMWQKNLQKSLNLSKAKTSRMIRNLESRNLIEKIPFGNTNKIRLK